MLPTVDLDQAIAHQGLQDLSEIIHRLALPSLRLVAHLTEDPLPLGASRIGGCPDLPPGVLWPMVTADYEFAGDHLIVDEPLRFLAQLNLAEISPLDTRDILPRHGHLYFFDDLDHYHKSTVFYYPGEAHALIPTDFPEEMPANRRYKAHRLAPRIEWTLPSYGHHGSYGGKKCPLFYDVTDSDVMSFKLTGEQDHAYRRLSASLCGWVSGIERKDPTNDQHRVLGWPDYEQNPITLHAQVEANPDTDYGDWFELEDVDGPHYRALAAATRAAEWLLLFQLDSVSDDFRMLWGDGGKHYWYIRRQDLQSLDFSRLHYEMQCG